MRWSDTGFLFLAGLIMYCTSCKNGIGTKEIYIDEIKACIHQNASLKASGWINQLPLLDSGGQTIYKITHITDLEGATDSRFWEKVYFSPKILLKPNRVYFLQNDAQFETSAFCSGAWFGIDKLHSPRGKLKVNSITDSTLSIEVIGQWTGQIIRGDSIIEHTIIQDTILTINTCENVVLKHKRHGLTDKLLSDIATYSNAKGEFTGIETETIAKDAYKFLFYLNDEKVTIEEKIDVLFLMIDHQDHATRQLRHRVFHAFLEEDSNVLNQPLLIAPLMFCFYCGDTTVAMKFKRNYSNYDYAFLKGNYRKCYDAIFKFTGNIKPDQSNDYILTSNVSSWIYSRVLIRQLELKYDEYAF